MTGVTDTTVVELIVFNYLTVSEALKKLAITLGDYSWYVDYEKDIHFYANSTQHEPTDNKPARQYLTTGTLASIILAPITRSNLSGLHLHGKYSLP